MREILDGFLFHAGWWSAATWLAFAAALALTSIGIARAKGIVSVLVALGGPFVAFALIPILRAFADPAPGCISECEGRLVILAVSAGTFMGWLVGLATALIYVGNRRAANGR